MRIGGHKVGLEAFSWGLSRVIGLFRSMGVLAITVFFPQHMRGGNEVFPSLWKEIPRYFLLGLGSDSQVVICVF